ncbi:MAG: TolC family protein [Chitinispirillaceae bacterium]|jgi:outer membrane protein TolC
MRPFVFFLFVISALLPVRAGTLSLAEAQAQLFKNNLDVLTAEVELQKAKDDLTDAQCAYFPSLDASGSYSYQTEKSTLYISQIIPDSTIVMKMGPNDRAEFGLDLTYPFFTGFSRYYGVTSRKEAVAGQQASLDAVKNRASLGLGILYYQWELSYREADLRTALVEQLESYAKQVAAQRAAGAALQSKLLEARARLQLAKVDLTSVEDETDSLRRELMSSILSKDRTITPDTAAGTALDTQPVPRSVKMERPELIALDHAGAQIEELRKVLRYRHFPTLSGLAGLRYGRPGLNMGINKYMGYGLLGLQLKWNLFDGFQTQTQDALLRRRIDLVDIERTRQIEAIDRSFDQAKRQVNSAAERLSACEASRAAARALAEDLKNSLAAGTATTTDYLNALVNQAQAELLVVQAKTAEKIALLQLRFAAGKTLKY